MNEEKNVNVFYDADLEAEVHRTVRIMLAACCRSSGVNISGAELLARIAWRAHDTVRKESVSRPRLVP